MDIIMSVFMMTSQEVALLIAGQVKAKRLSINLSQETLSLRSGVSYGVLKKFERTGQISLESLLKLALTLGVLEGFTALFQVKPEQTNSLDELLQEKTRKRGRQ
jgi:transcriptional regulator with XRE-family HTH domain